MAKNAEISTRRVAVSKANAQVVAIVAVAAFVTVFCLFAARAAWSQNRYQARVTVAKEKAHSQLEINVKAFNQLKESYKDFDSQPINAIAGRSNGTGDSDGKNSKIVLDALPSSYDFPALASSLEKLLASQSLKVASITGTDDQVNQQANDSSPNPAPISIPFSFSVTDANYDSVNKLITKFQQSIRPIQVDTINLSGGAKSMNLTVTAHTYYQPGKNLTITKKVVK